MPRPQRWPHPLGATLTALLLLGLALPGACVPAEDELSHWPTRDLLGLSPSHLEPLEVDVKRDLAARLSEAAEAQRSQGSIRVLVDRPMTPGEELMAVDAEQQRIDAPALLFVELERSDRLLWADAREAPLDAAPGEVLPNLDESFADHTFEGHTEAAWLEANAETLRRWLAPCAVDRSRFTQPRVDLIRAEGMPALVACWRQRGLAYLNPAALLLLEPPASAPPGLRTTAQPIELQPIWDMGIDTCTDEVLTYCEGCDTPEKAQSGDCNDNLFPGAEVWEVCQTLGGEIPQGHYRYCLDLYMNEFSGSSRPYDIAGCLGGQTDDQGRNLAEVCDARDVDTLEELGEAFDGFVSADSNRTCRDAFVACIPEPDNTPPPPLEEDDKGFCAESCGLCDNG